MVRLGHERSVLQIQRDTDRGLVGRINPRPSGGLSYIELEE